MQQRGFTIVELLIVVVVIGILAAITIIAYNGISGQARASALKSDLSGIARQLQVIKTQTGSYPANIDTLQKSDTTTFTYTHNNATGVFCVSAAGGQAGSSQFFITEAGVLAEGACIVIADGSPLQVITDGNCPSTRTRAYDVRDSRTYWVQKLTDGKCWMLTNLAYAGGGTNTHGDVRAITNGTSAAATHTIARYYVVPGANTFTVEPAAPSVLTNGTGQYGYLYNWCAAMGVQNTSACGNASIPASNPDVTVCPSGWRLPTGGAAGEFATLNNTLNAGRTDSDAGLLSNWLGVRSGSWFGAFGTSVGAHGVYWAGSATTTTSSHRFFFASTASSPDATDLSNRGFAVRCVAR